MTSERFEQIMEEQIDRCRKVLLNKAAMYARNEDRLHNFRIAAELQGCGMKQALAGMMAKHTVSVYDLCMNENLFSLEVWQEKITDHLNYLFLLDAVVREWSPEGC